MDKDANSMTRRLSQLFCRLTWEISPKCWSAYWLYQNHLESLFFSIIFLPGASASGRLAEWVFLNPPVIMRGGSPQLHDFTGEQRGCGRRSTRQLDVELVPVPVLWTPTPSFLSGSCLPPPHLTSALELCLLLLLAGTTARGAQREVT